MGGENWKKLSQNSDREFKPGNTSCFESVSGRSPRDTGSYKYY